MYDHSIPKTAPRFLHEHIFVSSICLALPFPLDQLYMDSLHLELVFIATCAFPLGNSLQIHSSAIATRAHCQGTLQRQSQSHRMRPIHMAAQVKSVIADCPAACQSLPSLCRPAYRHTHTHPHPLPLWFSNLMA
ncbi:hypothetical protein CCM_02416 [Cordyceps militaris CM01]|uniref:Uncharacterized protein n=1 Tax=Cordyceps militaris (strain CM01) TaxID=983644 RepID=G3J9L9_CORMM|nr:uncharacterized protein CCM_02416 [Cordyceps militaris CM01]EGX94145.1 hypothetical protein CCM_02416 [Cordyceps militaris CM01]